MVQILIFVILTATVAYFAQKRFRAISRNINLGIKSNINDNTSKRWKNMILFALGQKKMFDRPVSGIFHLFIYLAFLFTQIELLEIIADGLSGKHRLFAAPLGPLYNVLINFIEFLSLFAFIGTLVFLYRRNIMRIFRFQKPELNGWPRLDANLILLGEIILIIGVFTMNSADGLLQSLDPAHYPSTGRLYISSFISDQFLIDATKESLIILERFGWWLHLIAIFGFILYLPYSKHLHIFLAFPNSYYSRLSPRGQMVNIPVIENEARSMIGLATKEGLETQEIFGASDVFHMNWQTLLEAYSCTECGRCTASCPASQTGKSLSPRKVVMNIRDRMEEIGKNIDDGKQMVSSYDDGRSLFDYISREEIYACTSCNACVEACPVLINPLEPILAMRRYDILMNSGGPSEWLSMFNSLENNQSVWQIPESRSAWTHKV